VNVTREGLQLVPNLAPVESPKALPAAGEATGEQPPVSVRSHTTLRTPQEIAVTALGLHRDDTLQPLLANGELIKYDEDKGIVPFALRLTNSEDVKHWLANKAPRRTDLLDAVLHTTDDSGNPGDRFYVAGSEIFNIGKPDEDKPPEKVRDLETKFTLPVFMEEGFTPILLGSEGRVTAVEVPLKRVRNDLVTEIGSRLVDYASHGTDPGDKAADFLSNSVEAIHEAKRRQLEKLLRWQGSLARTEAEAGKPVADVSPPVAPKPRQTVKPSPARPPRVPAPPLPPPSGSAQRQPNAGNLPPAEARRQTSNPEAEKIYVLRTGLTQEGFQAEDIDEALRRQWTEGKSLAEILDFFRSDEARLLVTEIQQTRPALNEGPSKLKLKLNRFKDRIAALAGGN
jgi:hypothetical protein